MTVPSADISVIHVSASEKYDVLAGPGLLSRIGELVLKYIGPCSAFVVTDETVDAIYGDAVLVQLRESGLRAEKYAFPAGEAHKTWETLGGILEAMAAFRLTRSDLVVALGGGVPGDMGGFAAAVYARGIRFVQVPTTLLAAVDASVGGKTAVDLRHGKNMAGAFHQPSLVLTDTDILRDLPDSLLSDGAAEVIKTGVLGSAPLFERMLLPDWREHLREIVSDCVTIKRDIMQMDELDTGVRQKLNLGHTFGHAIEVCSDFRISHGRAVAMGTAIAAGAAGKLQELRLIAEANHNCGLPLHPPYSAGALAEAALSDKKRRADEIIVVLPEVIGACRLVKIPAAELKVWFERGLEAVGALA